MSDDSSNYIGKHAWMITQRFLIVFMPLSILIVVVMIFVYLNQAETKRLILETDEKAIVAIVLETISDEFDSIVSDLMILADNPHLYLLLKTREADYLKNLGEDFLIFSKRRKLYDQIRFLDDKGMEVVRVNFNSGNPDIVPVDKLQSKRERYYFMDTFRLNHGEVFVSPFDLNIEQGKIEMPVKPMIRFGVPVFDETGQKRGVVLLNYFGEKMLNKLGHDHGNSGSHIMLLNAESYWLKAENPENEWGFMYENKRTLKFSDTSPGAWEKITATDSGQIENKKGMYTFATVYPLGQVMKSSTGSGEAFTPSGDHVSGKDYHWKIVSYIGSGYLKEAVWKTWRTLLFLGATSILLLAIVSWFMAMTNLRQKLAEEALRESEERYRSLSNASFEAINISYQGACLECNSAMAEMFGYSKSEIVGMNPDNIVAPEVREDVLNKVLSGYEEPYETIGKRKDGTQFPIEVQGRMFLYKGRQVRVTAIRDLTEKKRAKEVLRESERMQGVIEMAGAVCHEMSQPLMAINGYSDLITMTLPEDDPLYKNLIRITEQIDKLGDITKKLTNITKYKTKDYLEGKIIDIEKSSDDNR